ncbi:MAG: SseB family protein [Microbacterium sp.]
MALFSRRPKDASDRPDDTGSVPPVADALADDATDAVAEDAAASVAISVSSFRGLGSPDPQPAEPVVPTAPSPRAVNTAAETVPGLRDNVLLRETLARMPERPTSQDLMDVARQVLQGHLFLRVKGDARALIAERKELPLAAVTIGERRFAAAFSSGAALAESIRLDGDADTTAMAQPVLVVLRHALGGSAEGLAIDPASAPGRAILPRDLIERMVAAADDQLALKTLLTRERTDGTVAEVAEALARVPLWAAVNRAEDGAPLGVAEGRAEDGLRFLEVYSHPLEVVAMGRGDQPTPITATQLAAALAADEGLSGVTVDPRGPWLRLTRADLAPVTSLAD